MNDNDQAYNQQYGGKKKLFQRRLKAAGWIVLWVVSLAVGVAVAVKALIHYSSSLNTNSDPVAFVTGNLLNVLILAAIVAQVLIYRKQWHVMERQWQDAERAYVSVSSLTTGQAYVPGETHRIVLTIENAGKLPADEISVAIDLIALMPYDMKPRDEEKMAHVLGHWNHEYGRTKLFRGNITFEIPIPLQEKLNPEQIERAFGGRARLILHIFIRYNDGFKKQRFDYAFRNEIGKWIPWRVWTDDDIEKRIAEERSRYHPK